MAVSYEGDGYGSPLPRQGRPGGGFRFEPDLRRLRRVRGPVRRWPVAGAWWRRPIARIVALASLAVAVAAWDVLSMWLFPGPLIVSGRILDGRSVLDGDTLKVADQRIRLYGVDTPELDQTCADGWPAGDTARRALAGIVTTRPVQCRYVETDHYGRTVAVCRVDGKDLAATLIRSGMGSAYRTGSLRYLVAEWQAWFDGLGIHAHPCISPSAWRRSR